MATLEQLIIFFLLIGVGVIARKVGVITPGNTPQLTSLVFNFAMPAIILSGITTEQPHISGKDLSIVLTSAFTTLILLIICSRMLARILRYEREYYGVITVMTTFTNVSMMGIPMIYSLYGSEAMIYITVFLLPYNLLFFSYGYYCMKDQSGNADVKHWHGAAPGSAMTHLAITGMVDGKSVNWKELVTDEQYHAH